MRTTRVSPFAPVSPSWPSFFLVHSLLQKTHQLHLKCDNTDVGKFFIAFNKRDVRASVRPPVALPWSEKTVHVRIIPTKGTRFLRSKAVYNTGGKKKKKKNLNYRRAIDTWESILRPWSESLQTRWVMSLSTSKCMSTAHYCTPRIIPTLLLSKIPSLKLMSQLLPPRSRSWDSPKAAFPRKIKWIPARQHFLNLDLY